MLTPNDRMIAAHYSFSLLELFSGEMSLHKKSNDWICAWKIGPKWRNRWRRKWRHYTFERFNAKALKIFWNIVLTIFVYYKLLTRKLTDGHDFAWRQQNLPLPPIFLIATSVILLPPSKQEPHKIFFGTKTKMKIWILFWNKSFKRKKIQTLHLANKHLRPYKIA